MSALELQVYELFKKRFSEDEARIVIQYFESKAEEKISQKKDIFLNKDDKVEILEKLASVESRITVRMFLFWMGAVGVLSGIMFAMLNSYLK